MTYRAPIPVGPEDEKWTENLSAKNTFERAVTALTDSSLAIQKTEEVVESSDLRASLRDVRDRRQNSLREIREMGLAAGLRADNVDTAGTETLRRTWMALVSKVTDDDAVLKMLIDEEVDALDKLKDARGHSLPSSVDNVVGTAVVQLEDDIETLRSVYGKL